MFGLPETPSLNWNKSPAKTALGFVLLVGSVNVMLVTLTPVGSLTLTTVITLFGAAAFAIAPDT